MEKYLFESQYLVTKERMIKTGKILAKKTKSLPIWLRVLSEIIIGILAIIYVYLAIIDKDIIITIYAILLSLSFIYNVKNMIFGSRQHRKLLADAKETDTIKNLVKIISKLNTQIVRESFFMTIFIILRKIRIIFICGKALKR